MSILTENLFESNSKLIQSLTQRFLTIIKKAKDDDLKLIALSGGQTPKQFYESLADMDIDWSLYHFTLTDERYRPSLYAGSNEYLLKSTLFKNTPLPHFLPLFYENLSIDKIVQKVNNQWRQKKYQLDLVLLGMGEDGHIASLFPETSYENREKDFVLSTIGPEPFKERLSLSMETLLSAKHVILYISGQKKWQIYKSISCNPELPISRFLHNYKQQLDIFWTNEI